MSRLPGKKGPVPGRAGEDDGMLDLTNSLIALNSNLAVYRHLPGLQIFSLPESEHEVSHQPGMLP